MTGIMPLGGSKFAVPSESIEGAIYEVDTAAGTCSCPVGRKRRCKHLRSVTEFVRSGGLGLDIVPVAPGSETQGKAKTLKLGYRLDEVASALQKEIRAGDTEAAIYWALLLYQGAAPYAWKRVLVTACEDIGLAAPEVVMQVGILNQMWRAAKETSWYVSPHMLTFAVALLCKARKSTEIEDRQSLTLEMIKRGHRRPVPEYAVDGHTQAGRERGATWAAWYSDRHRRCKIPVTAYTLRLWSMVPEWDPYFERVTREDEITVMCRDCGQYFVFSTSGDPDLMDKSLLEHLREYTEGGPEHRGTG